MRTTVASILGLGLGAITSVAQQVCPPRIQWQQSYGSSGSDELYALQQTSDGGFIFGGVSSSPHPDFGNRTAPALGGPDFWVVKTDAAGSNLWDRAFGSLGTEWLLAVQQTTDGGFILAGGSSSLGPSGNKTAPSYGDTDFWVVRIDAAGNKLWDQSFGGSRWDLASSVQQTSDGGFIVAGQSYSDVNGNKTAANFGASDFWVVRLNANGQKLWDRAFGGTQWDSAYAVRETSDHGFVVGGTSGSSAGGNKTTPHFGQNDFWVVRLDSDGNKLWDRSLGGEYTDQMDALVATGDGGFLAAGTSTSPPSETKTSQAFGSYDFWAVRLNAAGDIVWDGSYGGTDADFLRSASGTADGGFVLSGWSVSHMSGTKQSPNIGYTDYWIVRISPTGEQLWEQGFGTQHDDNGVAAQQTSDGGFVVGGTSYIAGDDRTSPSFGNGDFWVLKLGPETPSDCDGDGVPDASDLCSDTPAGTIVNSSGCALVQLCPCTNDWSSADAYVRCVKREAADFARAGLITAAEQQALIEQAVLSNCGSNIVAEPRIFFGLTHLPIGNADLSDGSSGNGTSSNPGTSPVTVSDLGRDGLDGVSIFTGEADSGIFLSPDAPIWGSYDGEWFLLGKAYGRLGAAPDSFVSSMRVTKPHYETYPIEVDLTPLGPSSLTFQVFSNGTMVAEATEAGATGGFTIYSALYTSPRGNPFWRMPDGSVGAIVELTNPFPWGPGEYYNNWFLGPFGDVIGDLVFIRANQPTRQVEFISRVDVTAFEGGQTFTFVDERLGMFGRPHRALGAVTMDALNGRLSINALPNSLENFSGVLVETKLARRFDMNLSPLELDNPFSSITVSGAGAVVDDEEVEGEIDGGYAQTIIRESEGKLAISSYFSPVYYHAPPSPTEPALVQLKVFRNGALAGTVVATNDVDIGTFSPRTSGRLPEIIACGLVTGDSDVPPHFALSFRHQATFTAVNGVVLRGNHVRIEPVAPAANPPPLVSFSLTSFDVPTFTITGESSVITVPNLSITSVDDAFEISWPTSNQPFIVESAPSISGPFSAVTNDVQFVGSRLALTLPVDSAASRFFRLRLSRD